MSNLDDKFRKKDTNGLGLTKYNFDEISKLSVNNFEGILSTNRKAWNTGIITNSLVCGRFYRKIINGGSSFIFLYTNVWKNGTGEDVMTNPIHVKTAVEYPLGNIIPVTFGGKSVGTIEAGGIIQSDPISISVPPNGILYERVSATPPMPPVISATTATTGGQLSANTYYYKVTCVTDGGESNASTEINITTTGSTSIVNLLIGDKNMSGVKVLGYNIYRSTSSNTQTLIASVNGLTRNFIDYGNFSGVSTTISSNITSTKTIPVASVSGFKVNDIVTINSTDYTILTILSDTSFAINIAITASSGATVTQKVAPPSTTFGVFCNATINTFDANEGHRVGNDLTYNSNSFSYIASNSQGIYVSSAILSKPASQLTTIKPPIYLAGDSIMDGTGYVSTSLPFRGFAPYALNEQFPYVCTATGGETASSFANIKFSKLRMLFAQKSKYSISNYGTNDLSDTVSNIKANLVLIAQRFVNAGVKTHFQCTLLPKAGSTDGWQTYANQSPNSQETNRQAINKWLRSPVSAGAGNSFLYDVGSAYLPYVSIFDTALNVEKNSDGSQITISGTDGSISNGSGGYWKVYGTTQYDTKSGTTSGTTSTLTDSAKSWTTNQWAGYMLAVTTSGTTTYIQIASNTATTLTFNGTTTAPNSGSTYYIYKSPTMDGTHPTDFIHIEMASQIDITKFI